VGYTTRNDCVLAETFLRLDHLENAVHKMKHEEMIKGIMMRLDNMQTEMAYLEEHAEEKVAESARRQQFKENVRATPECRFAACGATFTSAISDVCCPTHRPQRRQPVLVRAWASDAVGGCPRSVWLNRVQSMRSPACRTSSSST